MRLGLLGLIVVFTMGAKAQGSTIRGTVLNTEGVPMATEVTAYHLAVVHGDIQLRVACSIGADKIGQFICSHIDQGLYVLLFSLHQPPPPTPTKIMTGNSTGPSTPVQTSYAETADSPRVGHVPLVAFYPALSDWQLPSLLHVGAEDTQFVSVIVDNDATSTIEAAPAQGFATGQVQIFASGRGFSVPLNVQARIDPKDGYYLWQGLPAGQYKLIENWGTGRVPYRAVRNVHIGDGANLTTSLAGFQSYSFHGSVEEDNTPLVPTRIILVSSKAQQRYSADITRNGSFKFHNVPAGTYKVAFPLSTKTAVRSVQVNGSTVGDQSLYVDSASTSGQILVKAARGGGSIAGIVELSGDELHPGVVIESATSGTAMAVSVNGSGFFRVSGLPTGSYLITGWSDLSKVPYNNSAFLSYYKRDATSATVDSDSGGSSIDVSCNKSSL